MNASQQCVGKACQGLYGLLEGQFMNPEGIRCGFGGSRCGLAIRGDIDLRRRELRALLRQTDYHAKPGCLPELINDDVGILHNPKDSQAVGLAMQDIR